MHAAMGSPAAAVPAPEAEPPQQKRPSADSISVSKDSLVNLMDEDTEVQITPVSAFMYSKPTAYALISLHGICQCLVKHTQQAGCSRLAWTSPGSLQLCLASLTWLLQCMSATSGYRPELPGKLWKCLHGMAS